MKKAYHFLWNDTSPLEVFSTVWEHPYSLFFDSADHMHSESRYSFVAFAPYEIIEARDGGVFRKNPATGAIEAELNEPDPFTYLQSRLDAFGSTHGAHDLPPGLPPFRGGAAGLWGYDLGRYIETLPPKDCSSHIPDMAVGLYDQVFAYDHNKQSGHLFIWEEARKKAENRALQIRNKTIKNKKLERNATTPASPLTWAKDHTANSYQKTVQRVIDYIYEGDIFQANLSQSFTASLPEEFDIFSHYGHLRQLNPAPFAALMNFGSFQIASASPERFIQTDGTRVETKPIKGTRPRFCDKQHDEMAKSELRNSLKDRAENIMIVDLLRNDLSRVCQDDSIEVTGLCDVESFAGVHHLVSTITGRLRPEKKALDLLRACFPGGSITGAPKIRAMEIINELEPLRRGPYCGALGYIGFDGAMDSNIAIRTLVYEDNQVRFNVGGGVVANSDPKDEYKETLDKAAKLLESFEPATVTQAQDGIA